MSHLEAANHCRMMFTCRLSNPLLSQTGTELSCAHNLHDYCKNFFNLAVLKKLKNLISGFQWIKQKRWYRRICHFYTNFSFFKSNFANNDYPTCHWLPCDLAGMYVFWNLCPSWPRDKENKIVRWMGPLVSRSSVYYQLEW